MIPKFRAWDKDKKEMRITGVTHICDNGTWMMESNKGDVKECHGILMQSTGLFDKNKKEIFEGDICKDNNCEFVIIRGEESDAVGLTYDIFKSYDKNVVGHDVRMNRSDTRFEVIGNIHENPELVKKEAKL